MSYLEKIKIILSNNVVLINSKTRNSLGFLGFFAFTCLIFSFILTFNSITVFLTFLTFLLLFVLYTILVHNKTIRHNSLLLFTINALFLFFILSSFTYHIGNSEITPQKYYEIAARLTYEDNIDRYKATKNALKDDKITQIEYSTLNSELESPNSFCCEVGCFPAQKDKIKTLCYYMTNKSIDRNDGKQILIKIINKNY